MYFSIPQSSHLISHQRIWASGRSDVGMVWLIRVNQQGVKPTFSSKQPHRQRSGISPLGTSANGAAKFSKTKWQLDCEQHVHVQLGCWFGAVRGDPQRKKAEYNQHLYKLNRTPASKKLIGRDVVRELICPKSKKSHLKYDILLRSTIRLLNQHVWS